MLLKCWGLSRAKVRRSCGSRKELYRQLIPASIVFAKSASIQTITSLSKCSITCKRVYMFCIGRKTALRVPGTLEKHLREGLGLGAPAAPLEPGLRAVAERPAPDGAVELRSCGKLYRARSRLYRSKFCNQILILQRC